LTFGWLSIWHLALASGIWRWHLAFDIWLVEHLASGISHLGVWTVEHLSI
jgi:hypothetical protein